MPEVGYLDSVFLKSDDSPRRAGITGVGRLDESRNRRGRPKPEFVGLGGAAESAANIRGVLAGLRLRVGGRRTALPAPMECLV